MKKIVLITFGFILITYMVNNLFFQPVEINKHEQKILTWIELPPVVREEMKKHVSEKYDNSLINLDSTKANITIKIIKRGAGVIDKLFTINNRKYILTPGINRGGHVIPPYVFFNQKMFFVRTYNINTKEELINAEFGCLDFKEKY